MVVVLGIAVVFDVDAIFGIVVVIITIFSTCCSLMCSIPDQKKITFYICSIRIAEKAAKPKFLISPN